MSQVLKATSEQYDKLNGYTNGVSLLEFIKDSMNNWVVSTDVLTDVAFAEIHAELSELEEIEYQPIKQ